MKVEFGNSKRDQNCTLDSNLKIPEIEIWLNLMFLKLWLFCDAFAREIGPKVAWSQMKMETWSKSDKRFEFLIKNHAQKCRPREGCPSLKGPPLMAAGDAGSVRSLLLSGRRQILCPWFVVHRGDMVGHRFPLCFNWSFNGGHALPLFSIVFRWWGMFLSLVAVGCSTSVLSFIL